MWKNRGWSVIRETAIARAVGLLLLATLILGSCADDDAHMGNRSTGMEQYDVPRELDRLLQLAADGKETDKNVALYKQTLGSLMLASQRSPVKYMRDVIEFELAATTARNEKAIGVVALALHISTASQEETLEALMPYLDKRDEPTRRVVRRLLHRIDEVSPDRPPDFSYYQTHIQARQRAMQEVETTLVERMFSMAPSAALLVFLDVYERDATQQKTIRWAEKMISDNLWNWRYGFLERGHVDPEATTQLTLLSQRPEWWARLYAAEVVRQHPEFGTEDLVTRLRKDSHPLVQKAANAIRPVIRQ